MVLMDKMNNRSKLNVLISIYFDARHPASFSSLRKLYLAAKERNPTITIRDVRTFLQNSSTYTSFKPVERKFARRKIIVKGINDQWQVDLIVLPRLKLSNKGYEYILAVIDCFSRFAYVEPMRTKTASETVSAFKKILRRAKAKPRLLQSDLGSEFKGVFAHFLREMSIHQFFTSQDPKCAIVERFIRTFKNKLFKYMKAGNTKKYLDILQTVVSSYNSSKHRTLGLSPKEVNKRNEKDLWLKQYKSHLYSMRRAFKFKVGDRVRLTKYHKTFNRGFLSNWKKEVFRIAFVLHTKPVTYVLIDKDNKLLQGGFYEEELSRISG